MTNQDSFLHSPLWRIWEPCGVFHWRTSSSNNCLEEIYPWLASSCICPCTPDVPTSAITTYLLVSSEKRPLTYKVKNHKTPVFGMFAKVFSLCVAPRKIIIWTGIGSLSFWFYGAPPWLTLPNGSVMSHFQSVREAHPVTMSNCPNLK